MMAANYNLLFATPQTHKMLDVGEVAMTAESVKGARAKRQALEAVNKRENMLMKERAAHAAGDEGAIGRMMTISPEDAVKFRAALDAMKEPERAEAKRRNEMLGRAAAYILQLPEEQRPQAYKQVLERLPADLRANAPAEYDEGFVRWGLANAREVDAMMEAAEKRAAEERKTTTEDRRRVEDRDWEREDATTDFERKKELESEKRENKLLEEKRDLERKKELEAYKADLKGETASGRLKPAEANAIASRASVVYRGKFSVGPDGEIIISALEPGRAEEAAAVIARAEQIYRTNRTIGPGEAFLMAYEEITGKKAPGGSGGRSAGGAGGDVPPPPGGYTLD